MTIRLYVSKNCTPCKDVKDLIKEGRYTAAEQVELVDIDSKEGFAEFQEKVLDRQDGGVPSAFQDGRKCEVLYNEDEDILVFKCPPDSPALSSPEQSKEHEESL